MVPERLDIQRDPDPEGRRLMQRIAFSEMVRFSLAWALKIPIKKI